MRLFDLHCDTLCAVTDSGAAFSENSFAVDLHRGGRYADWVQTFAAFLPDGLIAEDARRRCWSLLDAADRWAAETPDFCPVLDAAALANPVPACRALLSVENGGALAADHAYLSALRRRGVRMVGLTWNGDNVWASGCFGCGDGLTAAGRQAIRELESLSMVVDVSHLGERGFWQLESCAQRPFVATHSNAANVSFHPRNLSDDQFRAIRDRGGIVGLNLYGEHLGEWSFAAVQRHLEHFLALNGETTVCFGTDLDGMDIPAAWNGIAVMEALWQYLAEQGYPAELLDAVFYNNAYSFFAKTLDNT